MALSPSPKACLGGVASGVVRLLNSTVNVCLVYGIDDTCSRELEVMEEGVSEEGRGGDGGRGEWGGKGGDGGRGEWGGEGR